MLHTSKHQFTDVHCYLIPSKRSIEHGTLFKHGLKGHQSLEAVVLSVRSTAIQRDLTHGLALLDCKPVHFKNALLQDSMQ